MRAHISGSRNSLANPLDIPHGSVKVLLKQQATYLFCNQGSTQSSFFSVTQRGNHPPSSLPSPPPPPTHLQRRVVCLLRARAESCEKALRVPATAKCVYRGVAFSPSRLAVATAAAASDCKQAPEKVTFTLDHAKTSRPCSAHASHCSLHFFF